MSIESRTLLFAVGLALAWPAAARIVCCDVNGKRVCGDPPPPVCDSRAKTIYLQGGSSKEIEAPLTAEQRAAREAEEARKKEEARKAAEQARKDRALLDSFTNVKELDAARERAIADLEKNAEQAKNRLEAALAKQKKLDDEKEFYTKKPLPAALKKQIEENEREIAAQRQALEQKEKDVAAVRERFAADRERYLQLTGKTARK
ncbi:hypothetical protein [Sulfuricystis multivorans]|uniref:hypothetical protein n=1 Tax=Sulfuricystis multivorans TaxID=2211108 RepID=UPI000F82EE36|nr:hypothetical protein [Sulfuricystis multivorans]